MKIDETEVTTVIQALNIIGKAGNKQARQTVSAELGTLIIVCRIITDSLNGILRIFIFPRTRLL